ncbi:NupC/NupG family nucleoside CNT transporter [Modicisalibacter zincidurans]|uniref:Nucleoside permease n=1 Tax=Modicisalibacter zincidurans TaxID=1178777 RepID=A0ABP9R8Z8_9GAMM|nr:NupC/NupG family nucleoside CNT transporter [Halomonas zincidurans]
MTIIMSLVGMAVLILIALLFSSNRRAIRLRTVGGAFVIQASIGAFVLYVPFGQTVLKTISDAVNQVVQYADDGISFLFGSLADPGSGVGFIFAIKVLPVIIFFSSLIAVLYYLGIMQWVIRLLGGALQKVLGTSRTESMSATANIFVGQTEAPLVVRPFIANMTRSELFAVMCGGLASVAGSVLGGYAALGIPMEYLVAASFMAAPGGLLFAKLIMPETEKPNDDTQQVEQIEAEEKPSNVLDAAAGGASSGLLLAANVGAMLLAFIALIALINGLLGGIGGWFGMDSLSLEMILGWLFAPLAFLLGIPWDEAIVAGSFIGQKLVVNEFVAFINLAPYIEGEQMVASTGQVMSEHTQAVLSFALCGFANLSSIAILLGGLGSMAPNRRHEIASFGLLAVLAGTLSNLMSAVIAGLFISLA